MYQSIDLDAIGMTGIESFRIRVIAEDEGSGIGRRGRLRWRATCETGLC